MNDLLNITAEILEKAAAYIDAVESAKVDAEKIAKVKLASEIKDSLSALTGEEVSAETAEKLAGSDDVLKLFTKIAGSRVPAEKLGDAGDIWRNGLACGTLDYVNQLRAIRLCVGVRNQRLRGWRRRSSRAGQQALRTLKLVAKLLHLLLRG